MTNKNIIEKYWKAANARDWKTFASLLHKNIVYDLPQSKERIRGRKDFTEFNATYPGKWTLEISRLVSDEKQTVTQIKVLTAEEEQTGISFFEFKDGLIYRIVEYWPVPYDPPDRAINGIERY